MAAHLLASPGPGLPFEVGESGYRRQERASNTHFSHGSDMSFPDRRTVDVLLTIQLFLAVCALLYSARRIIMVFVVAILFAYLIDPIVRFMEHHSLFFRNLRGPAVVEVYVVFLILIAVATHTVAPGLLRQTGKLLDVVPALLEGPSTESLVKGLGDKYGWSDVQELRLKGFLAEHREDIRSFVRSGERQLPSAAQAVGYVFVIPILAIFFLHEGGSLANAVIQFSSTPTNSDAVHALAEDLNAMLKKYIKAKVILGSLSFIFYSSAMLLLNFPCAIALGFCGGVLESVPVAGGIVAVATIVSVGILTHSHWIWMATALGSWRMVQDYVLVPRVMGHNLEIHPLLAIFAMMAGWEIGGIVGIYLAVPFAAAIRVLWRSYVSSKAAARRCVAAVEQQQFPGECQPVGSR